MIRALRGWLPALLWTALIFGFSSRPTLPVALHSGSDKLAHFASYAVFGFLLAHGQSRAAIAVAWAVVLGLAVGALDEFYQSFVPGRTTELADWVADALGSAAGVFIYHRLRPPRSARSGNAPGGAHQPILHE